MFAREIGSDLIQDVLDSRGNVDSFPLIMFSDGQVVEENHRLGAV